MTDLPVPDEQRIAQSESLCALLRDRIGERGISFAEYMHCALYEPGLGYYAGSLRKFGAGGDFVTAPELSPLFARCVARQAQQVLATLGGGNVLEFGAGTGALAADMLLALDALHSLPPSYYILEVSGDLRGVQYNTIEARAPHLLSRVEWLDNWPDAFCGFAVGNEVLDAMPVERFRWYGGDVQQSRVQIFNGGLQESFVAADTSLRERISHIRADIEAEWPEDYISEVNCLLQPWFESFADATQSAAMLLLDYGYPRREFYHPTKFSGTLRCYYQQRAHDNPFFYPGLQDITAHVDFTAVAEAGTHADMMLEGFTSQRQFLVNCGLADIAESEISAADESQRYAISQQVQKLTLPAHMGESFNAIGFSKNLPKAMVGFTQGDQSFRL